MKQQPKGILSLYYPYYKLFILLCILLNINSQVCFAQQPIKLQAAIDTALQNNLKVKNERLMSEYEHRLSQATFNIPHANIMSEFGQINSNYIDSKFGISQSFSLPIVYSRQKALQEEYYKSSVLNLTNKKSELTKQVAEVYYSMMYLEQKKTILRYMDSVYSSFLEKAELRFKVGESNILEKITAETQQGQIAQQLSQLQNDYEILQLQFQLLLNTQTLFIPAEEGIKLNINQSYNEIQIDEHPQIKYLQHLKEVSTSNTALEKTNLLPTLSLGLNNQSIRGMGADNIEYKATSRFNSIELGTSIPLFAHAQKARIDASYIMEMISENKYDEGLRALKTEYQITTKKYAEQSKILDYFEGKALPSANTIISTSNLQFLNGEINYLEWTMLIQHAINIQINYADASHELNKTIIQLNYLTAQ